MNCVCSVMHRRWHHTTVTNSCVLCVFDVLRPKVWSWQSTNYFVSCLFDQTAV